MRPRIHIPIHLRWGDLDAYNHVNNTSMLKLLEEARVRAFWRADEGPAAPSTAVLESGHASGLLTLIARQEIVYLQPVPYQRHPLDVQMWFGKVGGSSLEVCYEICSPAETPPQVGVRPRDHGGREGGCRLRQARALQPGERAAFEDYLDEPIRLRR